VIHETGRYRDPLLILIRREEQAARRAARPGGAVTTDPFGAIWIGRKQAMNNDTSDMIEGLLTDWYHWARAGREFLNFRRDSPMFRGCIPDSPPDAEDVDLLIAAKTSEQVDLCMNELPIMHRAAVGVHIANAAAGAEVFRNPRLTREQQHALYQEAKVRLLPLLEERQKYCEFLRGVLQRVAA
jgi:hypothetical protein